MPSITEALMGTGDFSIELDRSLESQIDDYDHLVFYWGEEQLLPGVVLTRQTSAKTLKISGRLLPWWLGFENRGPLIRHREYVSGRERLSNPTFDQPIATDDGLVQKFWESEQDSHWVIPPAGVYANQPSVVVDAPADWPTESEVYKSSEPQPTPSGAQYESVLLFTRDLGYDQGHIRLRFVYDGLFRHPDLITPYAGWSLLEDPLYGVHDIVVATDPTDQIPGYVLRVRTDRPELIINPEFDSGLTGWTQSLGTWYVASIAGNNVVKTDSGGPALKQLLADPDATPAGWWIVTPGEEYLFSGNLAHETGATGQAFLTCLIQDSTAVNPPFHVIIGRLAGTDPEGDYGYSQTFTIPWGYDLLTPLVQIHDHSAGGAWIADHVHLHRQKQNRSYVTSEVHTLIPDRKYKWSVPFRVDPTISQVGQLRMHAYCYNAEQDKTIVLQGPSMGSSDGNLHLMEWEFTVPTGLDQVHLQLFSEDVLGEGYVWVGQGHCYDSDPQTMVHEVRGPTVAPGVTVLGFQDTVPAGATRMHVEVVVDAPGVGWRLKSARCYRREQPTVGAAVAADCLVNQDTGYPVLAAGRINAPGIIQGDYSVINQTNMDLLMTLCKGGLYLPSLAWRCNPDATVDVGPPEWLFADTDVVLVEGDFILMPPVETETSVEDRPTTILIEGADVPPVRPGALPTVLTTELANPLPKPAIDWMRNPVSRTAVVSDTSADTTELMNARAEVERLNGETRQTVSAKLSDHRIAGHFRPGDWIYLYAPDAGLEDPTQVRTHRGREVFPTRLPVQTKTLEMGRGQFSVEIRKQDGRVIPIPSRRVVWSRDTVATVELGDLPPEFQATDQLGPRQFLRWLKSRRNR